MTGGIVEGPGYFQDQGKGRAEKSFAGMTPAASSIVRLSHQGFGCFQATLQIGGRLDRD